MKRLTSNLSSAYIEAANRLRPKTKKRKIVAYVESYDDIFFWRSVMSCPAAPTSTVARRPP